MPRLIDADAAYALMKERGWYENGDRDIAEGVLDQLPTVDAEPVKHGHWVFDGDRYRCSICGEEAPIDSFEREFRHKVRQYQAPYCYDCGAKMDEEVRE